MADKSLNEIRSTFLKYFEKNDHKIVESSNLVPNNDPTLMFANSGMVQFKNVFTGLEKRDYQRATTSQKCVRAGGKHNDLENVGYTPRHHTFFEMLGNFSFGDYFKEQAIHYAWNLITKDFGIDKNRLYVTVFHEDDEAFNFWKKIAGFSDDRIIRIATSDNFWSMGDTGPCGPCSEIFYDHGDHLAGGLPGTKYEDGNRFIEIWNLVFMQYEQVSKDKRIDLPKPSVDTGMGLERIAALLQGTHDNYETDHFKKIISSTSEIIKTKQDQSNRSSFRVIADHLRASAFLIAEGVLPSNEGRGYVLRRIMRRGMRHSHLLGSKEPVFYNLFETLRDEMSGNYPELVRADSLIKETLKMEEEKFLVLLDRGIKILNEEISKINKILPGEIAFKLYETYGFPIDLTEDILKSKSLKFDKERFGELMRESVELAKKNWKGSFFEMLGNFSFGDYFKEQAIHYAWNLITKDFGIDKNRLYVTVFHEDDEAFNFWKKIAGFSDDRIIRIATSDNFWSMGDTGPCGPCSEIFYDHGDHLAGGLPGTKYEDGNRFIEIWNLVFMQYEQVSKDKRIDLPKPSVDTGMGLERIAALLQGTHDNYETDHFKKIISSTSEIIKTKQDQSNRSSFRVIADHLRASAFLIAEGVLPSNEGRGYVLRRIMRRGMRHSHLLGSKEPVFYNLFETLRDEMSGNYPELVRADSLIKETLKMEEEKFLVLLDRGIKILNEEISKINKILPGEIAFKLYETYGFPIDLTEDILKSKSLKFDKERFGELMRESVELAKKNWKGSGDSAIEKIWYNIKEKNGTTEFLGYENNQSQGVIKCLLKSHKEVSILVEGDEAIIVVNQTPFYGESGGQVGDTGEIVADNFKFEVTDTQKKLGRSDCALWKSNRRIN
jgi:alanyl-tRNA synthetase